MKKQNNSMEITNLFNKIKSWIYNLFHKAPESNLVPKDIKNETNVSNELNNNTKPNNFFEEYKLKNERRQFLLNLQIKYKAKEISEQEMSEKDRIDLENLYIEQNYELKRKIRLYDSKITR